MYLLKEPKIGYLGTPNTNTEANMISKIDEIKEFNIGHFIIGESIFFGISTVIKKFKKIIK